MEMGANTLDSLPNTDSNVWDSVVGSNEDEGQSDSAESPTVDESVPASTVGDKTAVLRMDLNLWDQFRQTVVVFHSDEADDGSILKFPGNTSKNDIVKKAA